MARYSTSGADHLPVWPGDTLAAGATVDAIDDKRGRVARLSIATFTEHGVEVLRGRAVVRLPR